jgi:hypothetical protein
MLEYFQYLLRIFFDFLPHFTACCDMFFLCKRENIIGVLTIEEQKKGDGKPIYLNGLWKKNPDMIQLFFSDV